MKSALIFGRASGVWAEVAAARELAPFDYTLAVGSAGVDYDGEIDCWVSFHAELFPLWIEKRAFAGRPPARTLWSSQYKGSGVKSRAPASLGVSLVNCEGGSSGLIATMVALDKLMATKVVLAGVPLEAERGQYDGAGPWKEAMKHRVAWTDNLDKLKASVRSMSGWTAELLGQPTSEWLHAH